MRQSTLTCFGVGDGWPCIDRNHASFLYRFGEQSILIDCGESIDSTYKRSRLSYDLVDSIFLSHTHSDHMGGFFMLMQGFWLERRRKRLPVYLPGVALKPMRQMLDTAMLFEELLPFHLEMKPLRAEQPIRVGEVRVTPYSTSHLSNLRHRLKFPRKLESYCFLLESGKRRVAHSADLGGLKDLEPLLTKPLDLLVCELAHFPADEAYACLRGRPIKHIVFVHLTRDLWKSLARTRRQAAKALAGTRHTFATDLQKIIF